MATTQNATATAIRDIQTKSEFYQLTAHDINNAGVNELRSLLSRVFGLSVRVNGSPKNKATAIQEALDLLAAHSSELALSENVEAQLSENSEETVELSEKSETALSENSDLSEALALQKISAISSIATNNDAAILAAQGGAVSLTDSCHLIQVTLETGYTSKKLPSELMRDPNFGSLLADNGVKDRSSIAIFEALDVPVSLIKSFIPEWEPKQNNATHQTVSTSWATNILRARFETMRTKLFKPVSKELGWMFPSSRMAEVANMLTEINELCAKLVEILTCDEVYQDAKDLYELRVTTVVSAACSQRSDIQLGEELYIDQLMAEFPEPYDLRNKFKVTITPPRKLPSLAERLEADSMACNMLAGSLDSENALALASMQQQGLESLRASVEQQAKELQNELMAAVADTAKRITSAKGQCTPALASKLSEIRERIGVVADMLSGLSGASPFQELAERMAAISSAYVSDSEREESFIQLGGLKEALKAEIDTIAANEGGEKSAGHLDLESWVSL
jgi:hypothetical protein